MVGTQPWALHMETERVPRKYNSGRGPECQSDQWRNSGGKKGSTKLTPTRRGLPTIMRRYGLVRCRSTGRNMRYHEYYFEQPQWQASARRLFHTLPVRASPPPPFCPGRWMLKAARVCSLAPPCPARLGAWCEGSSA